MIYDCFNEDLEIFEVWQQGHSMERWDLPTNGWVRGSERRLLPGSSLRHNFFANDAAGIRVAERKLQFLPVNLRPESDAIEANELTDDPQIAADRLTSQCDLLVQDFASA